MAEDRREIILKNAKSLGNSLGTANKKSLNMSQHVDKIYTSQGIDQNASTLNDGNQYFTLAKTGVLNNLNLSQLLKSQQNILEDDGIEDLHFYFVSFNNHKQRVLQSHDSKFRKKKVPEQNGKKGKTNSQKNFQSKETKEQTKTIESMSDCELC